MRSPAWSPDEKEIAFSGYVTKNAGVWLMDQDGSHVRELAAPVSPDEFYDQPVWSPDGKKLAFVKQMYTANDSHGFTQASEIWTIDVETKKLTKIADGSEPSWSPDGKQIAYTKTRTKGEAVEKEVWIGSVNGSFKPRKVTSGMEPRWSPDGQFIAFAKITTKHKKVDANKQKAEMVASFREIWAVHVDSGKLSQLTKTKMDEPQVNSLISSVKDNKSDLPLKFVVSGQYGDWQPSWSKDGKSIVFVRNINEEKGNHFSLMKIKLKYE